MSKARATATLLCGVFALAVSSTQDAAAESEGIYFDFHAGALYVQEADNDATDGAGGEVQTSYDPGYSIGIALGYDFGDFRVEGELSTREADLDEIDTSFGTFDAGGNITASAGMINGYYDFDTGTPWRPYLGGGVGAAVVGFEGANTDEVGDFSDDEDLVLAFQAAVGVGYEFTDQFTLYGGYRFFGTTPPDLETNDGFETEFESEFYSHTVEFGIRYVF